MLINSLIAVISLIYFAQIPRPNFDSEPMNYLARSFYHADIIHLMMNMITLYYLNQTLTTRVASKNHLLQILLFSWVGSSLLLYAAHQLTDTKRIAIGFSGVIFSLIIINEYLRSNQFLTFSAEQITEILPQIFSPRTSFLGHLSGILTGVSYSTLTKNG